VITEPTPPPAPPVPPLPPSPPPLWPGPLDVVERLNQRFRHGRPSADLASAGVLVHQFDTMDDPDPDGQAWIPGRGRSDTGDRISASLVYYDMVPDPGFNIPIYSFDLAGLILSPSSNRLLCAYPYDVGTLERVCEPRGVSEWCIPGCTPYPGHSTWCDLNNWEFPCAFRPSALTAAMRRRDELAREVAATKIWDDHKYYDELIFESAAFVEKLPHSVEAMFYVPTNCDGDIHDGPRCEDYVRAAHRKFLQNFTLSEIQVPLLKFDLWNWDAPFSAMPNPSSRYGSITIDSGSYYD